MGGVVSDRLTGAASPALRVDYGMIAPRVRVLFGASYFKGNFDASEIARFAQRLRSLVSDPTNDFTINVGQISWSDLETDLDLQYLFPNGPMETYVGLGLGVHVRNGNGTAINGTFVEDALDTIVAGLNLSAGAMVPVTPALAFTADLRGSLTSELRSASARAGLMLRFPHRGPPCARASKPCVASPKSKLVSASDVSPATSEFSGATSDASLSANPASIMARASLIMRWNPSRADSARDESSFS